MIKELAYYQKKDLHIIELEIDLKSKKKIHRCIKTNLIT
jgi:hypothetical protein